MKYSYRQALFEDLQDWLINADYYEQWDSLSQEEWENQKEAIQDDINEAVWYVGSVTGNSPEGYPADDAKLREYITDDFDTVLGALRSYDVSNEDLMYRIVNGHWDWIDWITRGMLLDETIETVMYDYEVSRGW